MHAYTYNERIDMGRAAAVSHIERPIKACGAAAAFPSAGRVPPWGMMLAAGILGYIAHLKHFFTV